jgi:natural product precursor
MIKKLNLSKMSIPLSDKEMKMVTGGSILCFCMGSDIEIWISENSIDYFMNNMGPAMCANYYGIVGCYLPD